MIPLGSKQLPIALDLALEEGSAQRFSWPVAEGILNSCPVQKGKVPFFSHPQINRKESRYKTSPPGHPEGSFKPRPGKGTIPKTRLSSSTPNMTALGSKLGLVTPDFHILIRMFSNSAIKSND